MKTTRVLQEQAYTCSRQQWQCQGSEEACFLVPSLSLWLLLKSQRFHFSHLSYELGATVCRLCDKVRYQSNMETLDPKLSAHLA